VLDKSRIFKLFCPVDFVDFKAVDLTPEECMALPAPSPIHLLRSHSCAVSTLFISKDNERLYSGDSAGQVIITSTRSLRPLASWKAHADALLGIEEWGSQIIT
jgi:hypothetical protein